MTVSLRPIAAIALLVLLHALPAASQEPCPRQRLITVTGTAEMKVVPDQVNLTLGVETRDKDVAVAKAQNDAGIKKVLAIIREAGVGSKDVQTSALTMGPTYSEESTPRLLGFEVSQKISVSLKDISKYEALMTKALQAGVNRVDEIHFIVSEDRKYKDEARKRAIIAAREKAVAMAAELGQSAGKPWTIEEQTTAYGFSSNAGRQYSVSTLSMDQAEQTTLATGEVIVRASVQISFQLE